MADRMDNYVAYRRNNMSLPEEAIPVVDAYIAALDGRAQA